MNILMVIVLYAFLFSIFIFMSDVQLKFDYDFEFTCLLTDDLGLDASNLFSVVDSYFYNASR